jgi:hypothetical protein
MAPNTAAWRQARLGTRWPAAGAYFAAWFMLRTISRELNAYAHHVHPRRRRHGARLGPARRHRRHQARAVDTRADQTGATPDCQVRLAPARGVCPEARSTCYPDQQRGEPSHTAYGPLTHRTYTPGRRSVTSNRAPTGGCGDHVECQRGMNMRPSGCFPGGLPPVTAVPGLPRRGLRIRAPYHRARCRLCASETGR